MPLSIIIPALKLPIWPAANVTPWQVIEVQNLENLAATSSTSIMALILGAIYMVGVAYFTVRFLKRLFLLRTITSGIGLNGSYKAFTFFRKIYVNKSAMTDDDYNQVLLHERAHASQLHSVDLLLAESFIIMQWFNPFAWRIKQALTEVHEYIADKQALDKGANIQTYKELLFKQSIGLHPEYSNGFNYSLIKKRLTMITKAKPTKFMALRILGITMTVAALVAVFGCNQSSTTGQAPAASDIDTIIITLKTGKVLTLTAGNEEERTALKAQMAAIDPDGIQSINVVKAKNSRKSEIQYPATVIVTLKDSTTRVFSINNEEEKAAMEKEWNAIDVNSIQSVDILKNK
jgi:hypothetical protein